MKIQSLLVSWSPVRPLYLLAGLVLAQAAQGQTPHLMSSGNYSENFADISNTTNWPNGFNGASSQEWSSVAVNTTGSIPSGTRITTATTSFSSGSSGGVQRGTEVIQLLSTGSTNNSSSVAIDLNLDFTGRKAGTLSFDAATVFNSTGNRAGTLRVYVTTNGADYTEVTGTNLPYTGFNNVEGSASISAVKLPSSLDDSATAVLRFYYHNDTGGSSGSRPKISIDNLAVTSTSMDTAPEITTEPASVTISSGNTTTLSVVAEGAEPLEYQWYQGVSGDTTTPVGADSPQFTTPVLTATTSYWVRVSNTFGDADSETAVVTVTNLPVISSTLPANAATDVPVDATIAVNFSKAVSLTAGAVTLVDGMSNPVAFTGLPVEDVESAVLTPAAELEYGETYTVTVVAAEVEDASMNNLAADFIFSFTTEAMAAPVFTLSPPFNTNIASGGQATFNVAASGKPAPAFQWYEGVSGNTDNPVVGETGASYTTPALTATTQYWVRATNPAGTADSNTANVNVVTPELSLALAAPGSVGIGENFTYTLTATNSSSLPAADVVIEFPLPAGLTVAGATAPGFSVAEDAGVLTFSGGSLAAFGSAVLSVEVSTPGTGAFTVPAGAAVIDPGNVIAESDEDDNANETDVTTVVLAVIGSVPAPGDVIFNEYMSDNDSNGNDFFELLVLKDGLDLRGLRFSDNELITTAGVQAFNTNEAVYVFDSAPYLANVPAGTIIAVWCLSTGVTTDTTVNPASSDWSMTLCPGTGVTPSTDGLGGSLNLGFATGGEAMYLYLTGPDGTSAGDDNIYLDFISFENDGGEPPAGFADINLPSVADNAYYTGSTAAGNDDPANWVRYDGAPNASTTPGAPNPGQDLSGIQVVPSAGTLAFSSSEVSVNQGDTIVNVTLERTGGSLPTSVTLSTSDGSASSVPPFAAAVAGTDYESLSTSVEFGEGETLKVVPITLIPRSKAPNLRFTAALSSPTGGGLLGAVDTLEVRILASDIKAPSLVVKTPAAARAPATSLATSVPWPYYVTGTAGDTLGLDRVEIVLNGGAPILATLGASAKPSSIPFSAEIEPVEGLNEIVVTAYDLSGNTTSLTRSITFTRRYELALLRTLSGSPDTTAGGTALAANPKAGSTLPAPKTDAAQTASVVPGTVITLQAKPLAGFVFDQWASLPAGSVVSGDKASFTMPAEDVPVITANFLPNPFLGLGAKPVFHGLVSPASGTDTRIATVGYLTGALTTSKGSLSGKLLMDGKSTSFAGIVYGNGSVWFKAGAALEPSLAFDSGKVLALAFSAGEMTATVTQGASDESTGLIRPALHSKTAPLDAASPLLNRAAKAGGPVDQGYYTVILPGKEQTPPADPSTYPQGDGYLAITLAANGTLKLAGVLADKTKVTGSSALVHGHTSPVFAQLPTPGSTTKAKEGSLGGELAFDPAQSDSDVSGTDLLWIRPAVTEQAGTTLPALSTQVYTGGWPAGITVDALGALYASSNLEASLGLDAPSAGGNALLSFTGGKLLSTVEKAVNVAVNTTTPAIPKDKTIKASLNLKTGFFSGMFDPDWAPKDKKLPAFAGALLLKGASTGGWGHFLGNIPGDTDPESGRVTLEPAPAPVP